MSFVTIINVLIFQ